MADSSSTDPIDILLVEDNPGDVRLTQEAFESLEREVNFHVVTDGEEAVKYVQLRLLDDATPSPDLILLDLNLPRIDGFTVLELLEEELDDLSPPVLILSSSDNSEDIAKSYEKGCNAYLTKPDDMREFASIAQSIQDFWINIVRHPHISP